MIRNYLLSILAAGLLMQASPGGATDAADESLQGAFE